MKNAILLIIWMIVTLAFVSSVIGMLLFVPRTTDKKASAWMRIGLNLLGLDKNGCCGGDCTCKQDNLITG